MAGGGTESGGEMTETTGGKGVEGGAREFGARAPGFTVTSFPKAEKSEGYKYLK